MPYELNGKVVLITGAASGIGLVVVKYLLEEDVKHVGILDVNEEAGVSLQNELNAKYKENRVTFIKCDVADKERLIEAFERIKENNGYIDIVINGAGILNDTPNSYVTQININLIALITSSLHAWNMMHKEKGGAGGTIINFSSNTAISDFQSLPIYSATKDAVLKFSTILGGDVYYSISGVRVLTMCFGLTNTPLVNSRNNAFDIIAQRQSIKDFASLTLQSPEAAASAVIHVYKQGVSGSLWVASNGKPAANITALHAKSIELFKDYV